MPRTIFVNLPVKDVAASQEFFRALGFGIDPRFTDDNAACVVIEENSSYAMLLAEPFFQGFIDDSIADTSSSREVLTCLSCESRDEVDELYGKALAAGGKPGPWSMDAAYMYGSSFHDLDGHVWELMFMDQRAVEDPSLLQDC